MQQELHVQQTSVDTLTFRALQNRQVQKPTPQPSDTPAAEHTGQVENAGPVLSQSQGRSVDSNQEINRPQLEAALDLLNESAIVINARYSFHVNSETGRLFVEIKDQKGEIIRQEPPEAILDAASRISEMIGMFLDKIA